MDTGSSATPMHAEAAAVLWERTSSRSDGLTAEEAAERRREAPKRASKSQTADVLEEIAGSEGFVSGRAIPLD